MYICQLDESACANLYLSMCDDGDEIRRAVTEALISLAEDEEGRAQLTPLKISAIESAADSDWDDVRELKIQVK